MPNALVVAVSTHHFDLQSLLHKYSDVYRVTFLETAWLNIGLKGNLKWEKFLMLILVVEYEIEIPA